MAAITPNVAIPEDEIELRFVRASGPGGQNVNKVATAVQLRFDVVGSPSLPEDVRMRLLGLAGRRLTTDGILVIDARRYRTQERNRRDAMERLQELVFRATQQPKPRRKTMPTRASRERMLAAKHRRAETKRLRSPIRRPED